MLANGASAVRMYSGGSEGGGAKASPPRSCRPSAGCPGRDRADKQGAEYSALATPGSAMRPRQERVFRGATSKNQQGTLVRRRVVQTSKALSEWDARVVVPLHAPSI